MTTSLEYKISNFKYLNIISKRQQEVNTLGGNTHEIYFKKNRATIG